MENTRKILAFKYTGDYEQDFTDEHPLLIWMVAETVAGNYDMQDPKDLEKYLLGKFSKIYRNNADFGKSILLGKGNTGRDKLYAFMAHWSDAYSKAEKSSKKPRDYESAVAIKAVKAAVETLEIQDVRQNPELYALTEEEANTWSDEEIEVFLEEYSYDVGTAMPEFASKKEATTEVKLEDVFKPGLAEEAKKLIESYDLEDLETEPGRYDILVDTVAADWEGIYQPATAAETFGIKDQLMAEIKEGAKDDPDTLGNIRYDDVEDIFVDSEGEEVKDDKVISSWEFSWQTVEEVANSLADQLNKTEQVSEPYDEGSWYFGNIEGGGDYGLIYSFEMPEKIENKEQQTLFPE